MTIGLEDTRNFNAKGARAHNKNLALRMCVAALLSFSMCFAGCTAAQWQTAIGEIAPAAIDILQIVALARNAQVDPTLEGKIQADSAALNSVVASYFAADIAAQPTALAKVNATLALVQSDLNSVFTLANVSDTATQEKLTAEIGLMFGFVSIVTSAIPGATPVAIPSAAAATAARARQFARTGDLLKAWNKTLTAPTGNAAVDAFTKTHQLHVHGGFVRGITFGIAQ